MRAVAVECFGVDNVSVADRPDPTPGEGEVVIATEAATINPADFGLVTGAAASRLPWGAAAPYTPGWDLVGRVVDCGLGVDRSVVGRRVLGFTRLFDTLRGTQASLVALPVGSVVEAGDGLPSTQLTTVGLNGLTAWRGLADLKLAEGETLVVTGAAGGVGGFAVELASSRGFEVIAVVRGDEKQDVLGLGAAATVSADDAELGTAVRAVVPGGADALLDTASIAAASLAAVRDRGKYATTTVLPAPERGIDVVKSEVRLDAEALTTLVEMATSGRLHTPVVKTFEVEDVQAAYKAFAERTGRGRIVLKFPAD